MLRRDNYSQGIKRQGAGDLRVEPGEAHARFGQCVEVRRVDLAAEGTDVAVAQIVGDGHEDVGACRAQRAQRAHSAVVGDRSNRRKAAREPGLPTTATDAFVSLALVTTFVRVQRRCSRAPGGDFPAGGHYNVKVPEQRDNGWLATRVILPTSHGRERGMILLNELVDGCRHLVAHRRPT